MDKCQFAVVGMAVMGQNLALNVESRGYRCAVYNRTSSKTEAFVQSTGKGKNLTACYSVEELVAAMERPRRIMLMVKAGEAVDSMIEQILPRLEKGDILIDGGNSFFRDTERRAKTVTDKGVLYIGTGVSGGEEGALKGPSIMPGGNREAYDAIAEILQKIAAKTDDGSCVAYIGPRGAGHYVKMVHNGIEYGDMQLIGEAYDIMGRLLGYDAPRIAEVFAEWKQGVLSSYLMDITADILKKTDDETGKPIVDIILDRAGQKGTGKWTSQVAFDVGMAVPTITSAVESRVISALKDERLAASSVLKGPRPVYEGNPEDFIPCLHDALYASKITSYAQGMAMLKAASAEYGYELDYPEIARIWKGGCIIRAKLLDPIKEAFKRNPELQNLMMDEFFRGELARTEANWRKVVSTTQAAGLPCLAMSVSLAYYDAYRSARLPANLTQAQRDYFGAHTYERIDKDGSFHTQWI